LRKLAGVVVALAAMSGPVNAGVVEGMFEIEGGCFVRKYDPAHMRSHPDQMVTQISLETSSTQLDREHVILDLEFSIRQGTQYSALAFCTRTDRCGIEGDGGTFTLQRVGQQIRLTVGSFLAIEGDTDFSPNLADSDDRVFLLNAC
jgi:hypothetical protein